MFRRWKHKLVLTVTVILITANTSFAQLTFTNIPGDTIKDVIELGAKKIIDIKQSATGTDTLFLAWQKISVSLPGQWIGSICDNGMCYNALQDTGTMAAIVQGEYGFLSLHIDALVTPGTAIIRYAVWDMEHPAQTDTLTWIITAFPTGVGSQPESNPKVYSSNKKIYIKGNGNNTLYSINIYDLSGKLIITRKTNNTDEVIDMSSYNDGVYIIYIPGTHLMKQVFIGY